VITSTVAGTTAAIHINGITAGYLHIMCKLRKIFCGNCTRHINGLLGCRLDGCRERINARAIIFDKLASITVKPRNQARILNLRTLASSSHFRASSCSETIFSRYSPQTAIYRRMAFKRTSSRAKNPMLCRAICVAAGSIISFITSA
jgi:hypothetical protein